MSTEISFVSSDFSEYKVMGEFIPAEDGENEFRLTESSSDEHLAVMVHDGEGTIVVYHREGLMVGMLKQDGLDKDSDLEIFGQWTDRVSLELWRLEHRSSKSLSRSVK